MTTEAIPEVISHHADDAAFRWHLRSRAVHAADRSLEDFAKLDEQIDASLDGLRIAGDGAWELCREALGRGAAGEYFVASTLALELGNPAYVQEILDQGAADPDLCPGIIAALGWMAYPAAEAHIRSLLSTENPLHRYIAIAASAIHRQDPGKPLLEALIAPDPLLRARALRAAGELGKCDLVELLRAQFRAKEPACRFWAAWSSALLGDDSAVELLKRWVVPSSPFKDRALGVAVRRMERGQALAWQRELARSPDLWREAVQVAGILGDIESVPWLIEKMTISALARIAGASFSLVAGVDLAAAGLTTKRPEGFHTGPNDDPENDTVTLDPDADLPWPNPALVGDWWASHGARFPSDTRLFLGRPIEVELLQEVLRTGFQRQREAAALELAVRHPGVPLYEIRAPGYRQMRTLEGPLQLVPQVVCTPGEEDWKTAMLRGMRKESTQCNQGMH